MANRNRGRVSVEVDTFVGRLNRLFAVVYPPGRGPYRNFEVTQALAAYPGSSTGQCSSRFNPAGTGCCMYRWGCPNPTTAESL